MTTAEKHDQPEAEPEPTYCPLCDSEAGEMGSLGNRKHYRCRACGVDFSAEGSAS
jgi:transposase-like protein